MFAVRNASIMPYLGIDYLRTKLGDYTETSGQFPVRFNARTDENVYGTVGLSGHLRFTDQTVISAGVKHVQRLSRSNDPVSASVPGFDPFVVGAQSTRQWSEISVGGRFATPVKASSLDIGYRRRFASGAAIAQDMGSVFFTMASNRYYSAGYCGRRVAPAYTDAPRTSKRTASTTLPCASICSSRRRPWRPVDAPYGNEWLAAQSSEHCLQCAGRALEADVLSGGRDVGGQRKVVPSVGVPIRATLYAVKRASVMRAPRWRARLSTSASRAGTTRRARA
ncbi:autotransporter outer membrane beta-barrel domain-containing protein [Burkholderia sp. b13]|uniref:autotransporter outer membrane beta-barrel domain-containing protein n=1 Tax=Burkholderia sp. b13 TaxID=1761774 RepID=UPI0025703910|nr:autotransporter outer membrane beta-barrel domain-containing protein [Burkholderia sp. b13]